MSWLSSFVRTVTNNPKVPSGSDGTASAAQLEADVARAAAETQAAEINAQLAQTKAELDGFKAVTLAGGLALAGSVLLYKAL